MKLASRRALAVPRPFAVPEYGLPEPMPTDTPSGLSWKPQRLRVLVVDDERAMLETTVAILQSEYDVVGTTRPEEALRLLQARPHHVLVTDWLMPSMDGIELSRTMFRLDLPTACLLMTGYMEELSEEVSFESRRLLGVLSKPYAPTELIERVRELGNLAAMKMATMKASPRKRYG